MAKTNRASLKQQQREFHDRVINFFNTDGDSGSYNYKQVSAHVGASNPKQRAMIVEILQQLAADGFLSEVATGRFKATQRSTVAQGTFVRRSNGKNSVVLDGDEANPIMVPERNSMHALNGDKVMVHISAAREGIEPEAEVISIVEHKDQVFVGTLQVKKYFAQLVTDSKFIATDIFIPLDRLKGGKTGRWWCASPSGPKTPTAPRARWSTCWERLEATMPRFTPYWRSSDCPTNIRKTWNAWPTNSCQASPPRRWHAAATCAP